MSKYAYEHRVTTSPIPFETHLFMPPSTAQFFWKPRQLKLLRFKHWKSVCFHNMSFRRMFILALFANILENYYHYVDGIHYRSKYSTSSFRLKSKFDQIATLFNIFSNVSATCWCRENVSTTYTFLFPSHVSRFKLSPRFYGWLHIGILICLLLGGMLYIIQST